MCRVNHLFDEFAFNNKLAINNLFIYNNLLKFEKSKLESYFSILREIIIAAFSQKLW